MISSHLLSLPDSRYAKSSSSPVKALSLVLLNLPLVLFTFLLCMTLGMVLINYSPNVARDCATFRAFGEETAWPDFVLVKVVAER